MEDFPRATSATITYLDGSEEKVEAGETEKALHYEIEDMEKFIPQKSSKETLDLLVDVMDIMTKVRNQWGIKYPFE